MTLVKYNSYRFIRSTSRTVGSYYQSLVVMLAIATAMIGGIGTRLAQLQLVAGHRNLEKAEQNRIRVIPKQPERGNILDRQGRILASSRLSYSLYLWPPVTRHRQWPETKARLSKLLSIPEAEIQQRVDCALGKCDRDDRSVYTSRYLLRIARDLTPAQLTTFSEYKDSFKGILVDPEVIREYPHKQLAAHVLGYTGQMNEEDLSRLEDRGYRIGDEIGQMGVEAAFESQLRGKWGGRQVLVDNHGDVVNILDYKQPRPGQDLYLTLDLDLQRAAEAALGNKKGAIVALDPEDGAILAMVSRPTFDPNIFLSRISEKTWQQLQSQDDPFVNRALQGFPPASTFKIVTTAAALESGKFSPYAVLPTYPYIRVGPILFWDWNREGFGWLGFPSAMAWSSDTFFYQVALDVGGPPLIEWARKFGFGEKTGIELGAEEASGLVADRRWKELELAEDWYHGDTVNMSIGQGYLQASPLQVAVMFAAIANGGYRVKPYLQRDSEAQNSRVFLNLSPSTMETLQIGLRWVVTWGTGTTMNVPTLPPTAGKTGTAEDPPRKVHTWFGAYGPLNKPEIVVVAFGENSGGGGGGFTGPIARQVLEAYFKLKDN
ncbi:MAG: penicillin-binding protein 2 [Hormoscilla sp. GM7CHS1pb]|nr:penicillin-binding protein 2 [Hormoscilla sp. GM7CHS1pb]